MMTSLEVVSQQVWGTEELFLLAFTDLQVQLPNDCPAWGHFSRGTDVPWVPVETSSRTISTTSECPTMWSNMFTFTH